MRPPALPIALTSPACGPQSDKTGSLVIRLTRINRTALAVNADLIKFIEAAPDTVITLITGEKVVVAESVEQIIEFIVQFRRVILTGTTCPAAAAFSASSPAPKTNRKPECANVPG
jgi:flagellar protein FlbD